MNIGMTSEKLKLDSGQLALDFANTVGWHTSEHPVEKIHSYQDLIEWSEKIGVISATEAAHYARLATSKAKETQKTYTYAIELREALYRIFSAHATQRKPAPNDLVLFNRALHETMANIEVVYQKGSFSWKWIDAEKPLVSILWPVIRSTAEFLNSEELQRVGLCEDDRGCGWLFIDTSHNRSRRWCGTSCGNRAKVKRFRDRQKELA